MTERHAVIDASALLKLAFADPLTLAATQIVEHYDLVAPSLIISECANALWKAVSFANYPQTVAEANLTDLHKSVNLIADAELAPAALQLACDLEHPVYDCLYLALALRERLPLVSCDQKFLNKLKQTDLAMPLLDLHALPDKLP